ncbi:GNAT family N-acetyltransferase [Glutamicibacter ectropisis]|uniref:GNAT family N-acetyltransferase n=1 Tax=Glutamicibacter ectropisis TaxID=3046593 RepID=A0AAU6WC78_9MICC
MTAKEFMAHREASLPDEVARLIASVPEWFAQPESNEEYIQSARSMETWAVRDSGNHVLGVGLIDRHYPWAVEIHLLVVERSQHGKGVGSELISAIERAALAEGVKLMQVKTLGPSHPDTGYEKTRKFYEKVGFLAMEETELWGEGTPCLIMVKALSE